MTFDLPNEGDLAARQLKPCCAWCLIEVCVLNIFRIRDINSVHVNFDLYGLDLQVDADQGNPCEIFSASEEGFTIYGTDKF